ncbi:MAG TPA: FapA family protein [Acidobacteriota bacterium]|nr:FapA family protein [Acidobacteriota bacterium]
MSGGEVQTVRRNRVKTAVSKDFMSASILLRKQQPEEPDITVEEIMEELGKAGIVFGVDQDVIRKTVEEKTYNVPIRVATGTRPKRGASASFVYHFDTMEKHAPKEDEDGRIDYHDINFIQNTEKGALLVTKIPPTEGTPGTSVLGKEYAGPSGREIPINGGANTKVSGDELELRATTDGVIVFQHGKVAVTDVLAIGGDVDFSVGNLDCCGSVRVAGHVKSGFVLKIDGDLEISGNVEDATVQVKGNILVKGGFFGSGRGAMHADGDITVKYTEGQKITSGGNVYVGGEIINCEVTARDSVHIKGRRGKIVGGVVRAGKEIRASVVGSHAGTPTCLHVAYDAKLMAQYQEIQSEISRLEQDGERVKEALYNLYRLQLDGELPPDKQEALQKLQVFKQELPANLEMLQTRKAEVEAAISKLQDARIIVEERLYSGVKTYFGIVYREMLEDVRRCEITVEGNKILISTPQGR